MAARELTLDSKMRAFFRLSNFSHRYELNTSYVLLIAWAWSCLFISTQMPYHITIILVHQTRMVRTRPRWYTMPGPGVEEIPHRLTQKATIR